MFTKTTFALAFVLATATMSAPIRTPTCASSCVETGITASNSS